jgi:DNA repair protein RadC
MKKDRVITKPHYLEHRIRFRNRFIKNGKEGLLPREVIELFLTFVIPQKDVKKQTHANFSVNS